jgi:hypothetical protein
LQRTHELDTLLDVASRFEPELEAYQELCERVSGYYILDRYPMVQEVELESGLLDRDLTAAAELATPASGRAFYITSPCSLCLSGEKKLRAADNGMGVAQ